MRYLLLLTFVLLPYSAVYGGNTNNPVVVDVDDTHFECVGNESWFEVVGVYPPDNCGGGVSFSATGQYTVIFYSGNCSDREAGCNGTNDDGVIESSKTFWVYSEAGNYNPTWGGDNGMWGEISAFESIENVASGVVATGSEIWPLFALAGVALAFIIGLALINFLNQSVSTKKTTKKKDEKEDFIYHSAEDLEFKRNYGRSTK